MSVLRSTALQRLQTETFDVLIVGGGITGAGIAQDAAHRGLRTALVEKDDFASGTTHASTKLLHGGIRYLEQFQFRLMYEALHERNRLTRLAPDLAEWLPFLIPIYGRGWKSARIGIGLWVYDLLAGFPAGRLHRRIPRAEALALAPHLRQDGLRGAFLYYDCRTDDTGLTMAVLQSAMAGGAVAANYCRVTQFVKDEGSIVGAVVSDEIGGSMFEVRAKCTVNATGVWVDQVNAVDEPGQRSHLQPSKGAHIIVPAERLPVQAAVLAPSPQGDNRFIFVVPWQGAVLLGTTDTSYSGSPDDVGVDEADVDYILAATNELFPTAKLSRADVISSFAGLRPLLRGDASSTAALSREHKLWESASGLISIAGGKLTTYRTMAMQVTDFVLRRLGHGHVPSTTGNLRLGQERHEALAQLVSEHPELSERLIEGLPHIKAEAAYAASHQLAVRPDDFLSRRTRIALLDRAHGETQRQEVEALLRRFGDVHVAEQSSRTSSSEGE